MTNDPDDLVGNIRLKDFIHAGESNVFQGLKMQFLVGKYKEGCV